jgi:hypothetical protein
MSADRKIMYWKGILHMVNKTTSDWVCRRQNAVEIATYGSELTAARQATEQIMDIFTN